MPKMAMRAHLIERDGIKRCSICNAEFAEDAKLSLSKAFAEHVRSAHKTEPPKGNARRDQNKGI